MVLKMGSASFLQLIKLLHMSCVCDKDILSFVSLFVLIFYEVQALPPGTFSKGLGNLSGTIYSRMLG